MSGEDIWTDDLLDRKHDADFLVEFLTRRIVERGLEKRTKSYVLNLDAPWGQGKTFFLDRLRKQLQAERYLTVYINAWKDDHADTPLVAVMAALEDALSPFLKSRGKLEKTWSAVKANGVAIAGTVIKGVAGQAIKKVAGNALEQVAQIVQAHEADVSTTTGADIPQDVAADLASGVEAVLDRVFSGVVEKFRSHTKSIEQFKGHLAELIKTLPNEKNGLQPILFVLIDELDRCRPPYSIAMLEQVKHLFDVNNIVFIIATDTSQLAHSVNAVYGTAFDGRRYLLRFFDRTFMFADPTRDKFIDSLFSAHKFKADLLSSPPNNEHKKFFAGATSFYELSLRDCEQCFDVLRSIATIWPHKARIELLYLLPLIISHHKGDSKEFQRLARFEAATGDHHKESERRGWDLIFPKRDDFGRSTGAAETVTGMRLLDAMMRYSTQPLADIHRGEGTSSWDRWLRNRFGEEFSVIHGNMYAGISPRSILSKYPSLVIGAARLTS